MNNEKKPRNIRANMANIINKNYNQESYNTYSYS